MSAMGGNADADYEAARRVVDKLYRAPREAITAPEAVELDDAITRAVGSAFNAGFAYAKTLAARGPE